MKMINVVFRDMMKWNFSIRNLMHWNAEKAAARTSSVLIIEYVWLCPSFIAISATINSSVSYYLIHFRICASGFVYAKWIADNFFCILNSMLFIALHNQFDFISINIDVKNHNVIEFIQSVDSINILQNENISINIFTPNKWESKICHTDDYQNNGIIMR